MKKILLPTLTLVFFLTSVFFITEEIIIISQSLIAMHRLDITIIAITVSM